MHELHLRHDDYKISLDEGEDALEVLAAILKASYDFSYPLNFEWEKEDISLEEFKQFVDLGDTLVTSLEYMKDQVMSTHIIELAKGEFFLTGALFHEKRGCPLPVFQRAREILSGQPHIASAYDMQRGQGLDYLTSRFETPRRPGEQDWDFIQRCFHYWNKVDPIFAVCIAFGLQKDQWDEATKFLIESETTSQRIDTPRWIYQFPLDPLRMLSYA